MHMLKQQRMMMEGTAMKSKTLVSTIVVISLVCTFGVLAGCSGKTSSSSSKSASSSQTQSSVASSSASSQATSAEWPDNANTADVPRPTFAATPVSVIDSGGITAITYSKITADESAVYLQSLKDAGFTQIEADTNVAGTVSYVARNVDTKTHLSYSFTSSSGTLTVSLDRIGV